MRRDTREEEGVRLELVGAGTTRAAGGTEHRAQRGSVTWT